MRGVRKYPKDTVIAREGDSSTTEMYMILHGSAGVYRDYRGPGERITQMLEPGAFFGELTLFAGRTRTESLVAVTDVIAIGISRDNCAELFAQQPELTFGMFETFLRRLSKLEQEHEALLIETGRAKARTTVSGASHLFPDGHGTYTLALANGSDCLFEDTVTCPLCGNTFKNLSLIATKLRRESTDKDMRVRYKDIEPLHYEIITCSECLFSAQVENFAGTSRRFWSAVTQALSPYRAEKVKIKTAEARDTFTVFAGYYLSLLCAPVCYDEYQLVRAGLWQKIGRLYSDCGDEAMVLHTLRQALTEYRYAFEHFTLTSRKDQQVCYMIGDLLQRLGELDEARNFFFQAKTNQGGTPLLKRQAELRLDEIRELKAAK